MAHCNTVLSQILKWAPRHEFETLAKRHHSGRSFRVASRWAQFVGLFMAQPTGRDRLRDIVDNLGAQAHRLYHLGGVELSRSSLARINRDKALYVVRGTVRETVATLPRGRARAQVSFQYSLDATTIELCLSAFPWADFRTTKGAVKLHVGLNHRGCLPEFAAITDGKTSDIAIGRTLRFPKGSLVVIDRGYNDYDWYKQLNDNDTFFVTRIKKNAAYRVVGRAAVLNSKGLTCDQRIVFTGVKASRQYPIPLRRIGYLDADTGKHYVFLTNNFKLAAKTIADLYKARWQVELFFKWIKQNLKIKSFIGASHNAVMTQIWIALCVYLRLAFIKFQSRLGKSLQQMLRLLHPDLFEKRDLMALLRGIPPPMPGFNRNQSSLL